MSKLKMSLIEDGIYQHTIIAPKFSLRRNRKRPLHPETIQDLLKDKYSIECEKRGWKFPYGWLITLIDSSGVKHFRSTHSKASYKDAVELRDYELAHGDYDEAWIKEKSNTRD